MSCPDHLLCPDPGGTTTPVKISIATLAALQVIDKYYALTDDNEVYRVAISVSPVPFYPRIQADKRSSHVSR